MIAGLPHRLVDATARAVRRFMAAAGSAVLMLVIASFAVAQEPSAPRDNASEQEPAPSGTAPAPLTTLPTPPEVVGAIGRLLNQSISNVGAGVDASVRGAGETLGATTTAAGELAKNVTSGVTDAAGSVARLPLSNVVAGWQRCTVAGNGAPDCGTASVALCQSKGFASGSSLDITSARKCRAQVWIRSRQPGENDCVDESFVSRAMCNGAAAPAVADQAAPELRRGVQ